MVQAARGDLQPAANDYDTSGPAKAPMAPSAATVLLNEAMEEGDVWLVEAALASGADKDAKDKVGLVGGGMGPWDGGSSGVRRVREANEYDVMLLKLTPCAQDGYTALMRASGIDPKMVQVLLDAGADREARHFVGGGGGREGGRTMCSNVYAWRKQQLTS